MDLGVLAYRFSKINNMTSPGDVGIFQTTGHPWRGAEMTQRLLEQIQEVVRRDPQSRDPEDQQLQKKLYWDLARILPSFARMGEPTGFIKWMEYHFCYKEEFLSPIFYYLQDANWNKVDVNNVENWKLWYPPIPVIKREAELPPHCHHHHCQGRW